MKITKIKIRSFGMLVDREFVFSPGANVIAGENESGKTSLAAFIKFALYGLDGKKGSPTEKERYINRASGRAAGVMEFTHEGRAYRIERAVGDGARETKTLVDLDTLAPVRFDGEIGEYLFGVPESVFLNTAYIRQATGSGVDGGEIKNAVANILSSADEKISVEKVQKKLDAERTKLKHKNTVGGRLRELEREIAAAEQSLAAARSAHSAVIAAEGELRDKRRAIERADSENEKYALILQLREDMRVFERRERLERALSELRSMRSELEAKKAALPDPALRQKAAQARARINSADAALAEADEERGAVGEGSAARFTLQQCEADRRDAEVYSSSAKAKKIPGAILLFFGILAILCAGAAYFFLIDMLSLPIIAVLGGIGVLMLIAGIVLLAASSSASGKMYDIFDRWDVDDLDALEDAIGAELDADARERARLDEIARLDERLIRAETEYEDACGEAIRLYEENFGDAGDLAPDIALGEIERRIAEAEADFAEVEGEYKEKLGAANEMEKNLRGVDFSEVVKRRGDYGAGEEWKIAASLDDAGAAATEKKLRFNSEKIRALEAQCEECKKVAYSSPGRSPAEVEEELDALRRELSEGEERLEALELAMNVISRCGDELRQDLIPGVVARASSAFAAATAGRHDRLSLGEDFSLRASGEDGAFSADMLSTGGADAAYICLRRALTPALYGKEAPPAIYDESFSSVDEARTLRLITFIAADDAQALIFTCRTADAERVARELAPSVNVIRM